MWIYFVENVWCYDPDEWSKMGWTTRESQSRFWDTWHFHTYPDGRQAYNVLTTYPQDHMEEGNDYFDF